MKKTLLIVIALLGLSLAAVAQPKAIGIRGGLFGPAFNGEISYEHWLTIFDNDYDFLEAELGVFGGNGFMGTVIYNFTFVQPDFTDRGEWGLYGGPGIVSGYGSGIRIKNENGVQTEVTRTSPFLGFTAQLGMEYTFWFPLQVSVDFRPTFLIPAFMNRVANNKSRWYGFAVSARYAF